MTTLFVLVHNRCSASAFEPYTPTIRRLWLVQPLPCRVPLWQTQISAWGRSFLATFGAFGAFVALLVTLGAIAGIVGGRLMRCWPAATGVVDFNTTVSTGFTTGICATLAARMLAVLNFCFFATGNPSPLQVSEPSAISDVLRAVELYEMLIPAHKYGAFTSLEKPLLTLEPCNCLRLISTLNIEMNRFIPERLLFLAKYCTQYVHIFIRPIRAFNFHSICF